MTKAATPDEFMTAVGHVTHRAALADMHIFSCFQLLIPAPATTCRTIYYFFESIHSKTDLTLELAEDICNAEELHELKLAIAAAKKVHKIRQRIAHSAVGVDGDGAAHEVNFKRDLNPGPMKSAELQRIISDADSQLAAARIAYFNFSRLMSGRPKGTPFTPPSI